MNEGLSLPDAPRRDHQSDNASGQKIEALGGDQ
jgi:hypothetical protein